MILELASRIDEEIEASRELKQLSREAIETEFFRIGVGLEQVPDLSGFVNLKVIYLQQNRMYI
jgi:hypothetical protein